MGFIDIQKRLFRASSSSLVQTPNDVYGGEISMIISDMAIRVGIVEDNGLLRYALESSLNADGFEVVFAASDGAEALSQLSHTEVDVLVVDLNLGRQLNGVDVSLAWQKHYPKLGVVYLTSYEDPRAVVGGKWPQLAKNYVYLLKDKLSNGKELEAAINRVAAQEGHIEHKKSGPLSALTDSQFQVLSLLASGASNKEIAKHRGITEASVAIAVNRISKALGIPSHLDRNQRVHLARVFLNRTSD